MSWPHLVRLLSRNGIYSVAVNLLFSVVQPDFLVWGRFDSVPLGLHASFVKLWMDPGIINTVLPVAPGPADFSNLPGNLPHTKQSSHPSVLIFRFKCYIWTFWCWALCLSFPWFLLNISCCIVNTVLRSTVWFVSPWGFCLLPSVYQNTLES